MRFIALAASAFALAATTAIADPIEERQEIMKAFGDSMRTLGPIAQGQADFDAAAVQAALETLNENAQAIDVATLFPEGSVGDSRAAPAIWENLDDFTAKVEAFQADTAAAVEAAPQDIDAFREVFGPAASNCGTCHESYRIERG